MEARVITLAPNHGHRQAKYEAMTARMTTLREMGYSNHKIASVCGCAPSTVYMHIGSQPAEITATSKKLAGHINHMHVVARKAARTALDDNFKASIYGRIIELDNEYKKRFGTSIPGVTVNK